MWASNSSSITTFARVSLGQSGFKFRAATARSRFPVTAASTTMRSKAFIICT